MAPPSHGEFLPITGNQEAEPLSCTDAPNRFSIATSQALEDQHADLIAPGLS